MLSKLNDYIQIYIIYIAVMYGFIIIIITYPYSFDTYDSYPCEGLFYPPFWHPCIFYDPHYYIPDLCLHTSLSSPLLPTLFTSASIYICSCSCACSFEGGYYPYSYSGITGKSKSFRPW